jgi:hypothetical protein
MEPGEHRLMARDEERHWWSRGLRDAVARTLVYVSDLCDPEIRCDRLDLVLSLDVIYIPGVARALGGLARIVERLAPGGLFVVNLPAYDWLYSEHDRAIHTRERYTARRVRELLGALGLRPVLLTYRLCLLFPLVVAGRLPGILRARRPAARPPRSDLHREPGPLAGGALFAILRAENALLARGARLPWGSSVFAVGRRPPSLSGSPAPGAARAAPRTSGRTR